MKILLDQGVPAPLRRAFADHDISTAFEMGWAKLMNGDLLRAAEGRFEVFITTDKNLRHQQNLTGMVLAILVLPTTSWPRIQRRLPEVVQAVTLLNPGDFCELQFPE
jgi:hypothetical protein